MKFYNNLKQMVKDRSLKGNETVWRGEDGSYAVGNTFQIDVEEGTTDYIEAGKVEDYRN